MPHAAKNIETIASFYDAIAVEYNSRMTSLDQKVRQSIQEVFKKNVPSGWVLDFGGGTGLDLDFLVNGDYQVYFLEPSVEMRSIAKKNVTDPPQTRPVFIEENLDFNNWDEDHLPLAEKMNGVIANFAVVNCIPNVKAFFDKIALVCDAECRMLITVMDASFGKVLKHYSILSALKILFFGKLKAYNKHNDFLHETYIYSRKTLLKAASPKFKMQEYFSPDGSDFCVLILSRK